MAAWMLPAAIVASGIASAAGSIFGGGDSGSSKHAQRVAASTQKKALEWQKEQYYLEQAQRKPYYDLSLRSLPGLEQMVQGGYDITQDPLYQARSAALESDANKWAAARGLSLSGSAALKNVNVKANLMQDLTTQRFNQLGTLANLGTQGLAQTPNLQPGYSNLANIQAQSYGSGTANTLSQLSGLPMNMLSSYMMYNQMNSGAMGAGIAGMINS